MVPKRRRPARLSNGGLGGPQAKEAPSPQRRGPRWSQRARSPLASAAGASVTQSEMGPLVSAARAWVIPKRKRPPHLRGGGLGDPKAKEAPLSQRRGPR